MMNVFLFENKQTNRNEILFPLILFHLIRYKINKRGDEMKDNFVG